MGPAQGGRWEGSPANRGTILPFPPPFLGGKGGGEGGGLPILAEIDFKIVLEGGGEWGPLKGGDALLYLLYAGGLWDPLGPSPVRGVFLFVCRA